MANEATAEEGLSEDGVGTGTIELAGRRADEIVSLLRETGYHVEVKKLAPGPETKLRLEVTYPLEDPLFHGGDAA